MIGDIWVTPTTQITIDYKFVLKKAFLEAAEENLAIQAILEVHQALSAT